MVACEARDNRVIQDYGGFMLRVIRHTEKFPRHPRYSLGIAMNRNGCLSGVSPGPRAPLLLLA